MAENRATEKTIASARWRVSIVVALVLATGCASRAPQVSNRVPGMELRTAHSSDHAFTRVRAYEYRGSLWLTGDARHTHGRNGVDSHVDLAVADPAGKIVQAVRLALRPAHRRGGSWNAAVFSARLPCPVAGSRVLLAFHDDRGGNEPSTTCSDNQAAAAFR